MLSTKKSAIAGSWSYHQRNINADSRILSQQSSLSVELPFALHTTFHRGPRFDRWKLLAQADHQLWVDPKFKDPFSAWLDQYQIAQPPVNIPFKPVKAMFTFQLQSSFGA
jgi:hypothetical protein